MSIHSASLLHTRTRLQAGNAASDQCYAERNVISFDCALMGWPKTEKITLDGEEIYNYCRGNRNEIKLMECLQKSGETNWWKDFANCTSDEQCLALAREKDEKMTANL